MRFLSIYKCPERNAPPSPDEMARMGKFIEESMKAGWLLGTEGCMPSAMGARVRVDGGKLSVSDGPFSEAKEVVGGFALIEAPSKEAAVQRVKEFLQFTGEGECELRLLFGGTRPDANAADHNGAAATQTAAIR